MILIAAVDNRNGLLFNHRRQSQDCILRERILEITEGKRLLMNAYSAKQFPDDAPVTVDEDFLLHAGKGDFCFMEDQHVTPVLSEIEAVILFKWNRDYPGDFFFDLDLSDPRWRLQSTEDFAGSSHEEITQEVYALCPPI